MTRAALLFPFRQPAPAGDRPGIPRRLSPAGGSLKSLPCSLNTITAFCYAVDNEYKTKIFTFFYKGDEYERFR